MITYYNDHDYIYDFPGGYRQHKHHHCYHPQLTEAIETSKEVVISDISGERYKIQLSSDNSLNGLRFWVNVINCKSSSDNYLMHVYPNDENGYADYKLAQKKFAECMHQYDSLVKAETQDFDNVDVYASKIGYRLTYPKCCLFCKYGCSRGGFCNTCLDHSECQTNKSCNFKYDGWPMPKMPSVLRCICPENVAKFSFVAGMPHVDKNYYWHVHDSWQKLPWMDTCPLDKYADRDFVKIYPTVSPFGRCLNFKYADWIKPDDIAQANEIPSDATSETIPSNGSPDGASSDDDSTTNESDELNDDSSIDTTESDNK